ncbi:MAG: DNA alkylation repair protein [Pseudomonadota bacterium]
MAKHQTLTAAAVTCALQALGDKKIAVHSQRFFKTGPGDYGEGDVFIGVRVPVVRAQVKAFRALPQAEVEKLLHSKYHEVRLCAVLLMVEQFQRRDESVKKSIYDLYIRSAEFVNNWDLVDCSAYKIVGPWLESRDRKPLYKLAKSKNLWEKRIAIMSTLHFIRHKDFVDCLQIAELLLHDEHDLIHKAVGWMLREVGNRNKKAEQGFLKERYSSMPRTMLRYAIEKFPKPERDRYLTGKI